MVDDRERFRVLVSSVKDYAIFMLDTGGRVQTWNTGAELIKGYRFEEIFGRHIEIFYTPGDRDRGHPAELLAEAVAMGRVEEEGWRVRKGGTLFWADVVITALRGAGGELTGFAKVTRDLTERRAVEEQRRRRDEDLLRSEERFRILIDAVQDYAIFMLDPTGRVATWNGGAERVKGYRADEIIGQHFSRFRTEEDVRAGKCEQELETATRVGRMEDEGWRVRKDGGIFWANVVLTAVRNAAGELTGFAKVTRDLTERRRLDEERLGRARAEEAMRLKDEFLSIASHELRTPLTALQVELHALTERIGAEDERLGKRTARAARQADRLAALVESLLDVTRIANGQIHLKIERFDLSEVVSQLVDGLRASAAKAGCEIAFSTTGAVEGTWDRLRVEQIVTNVLSNAVKYGGAGGGAITLSISRDGDYASIEIADHGPGIPEQDLARIFGRFERAAPSNHYGGLGLGLYVSRELAAAHGGAISARNLSGGGASFTIRLPVAVPAAANRHPDS